MSPDSTQTTMAKELKHRTGSLREVSALASESQLLVKKSIERSATHGLPRVVSEKSIYIRALWLLAWLVCCCLFLRQLIFFSNRLLQNEVTTNFHADAVPFEYPDLYFCYGNPTSGSRHMEVDKAAAEQIDQTFRKSVRTMLSWCKEIGNGICDRILREDAPEIQLNSLPYQLLVDRLGHALEQSFFVAELAQSNGLSYHTSELPIEEFYHPSHLRCFRTTLNATFREELRYAGPEDALYYLLMMDAPDSRMGRSELPNVQSGNGNITAPYWALDKHSLSSRIRDSVLRVYITRPGHYPTDFDNFLMLEAGRTYDVHLEMKELVHREDPDSCVASHPDVQLVNPYDNTPYNVSYDYAYCYNSAVQEQFLRELNVTCANLPHPWPPAQRSLYNLSSGWGSAADVVRFLEGKDRLHSDEPRLRCARANTCTERVYTPTVESVLWPSEDSIDLFFKNTKILNSDYYPNAPGLRYLRGLAENSSDGDQQMIEYIRANFLQLLLRAKKPTGDQIIFTRAYSFESFVADIGGIMGVYLGMSLLTLCELIQFVHDLFMICWARDRRGSRSKTAEAEAAAAVAQEPTDLRGVSHM